MKSLIYWLSFVALALLGTHANAADDKYSKQQLDQMLAPIALYPDDLLSNVLMAATYPLDVVEAARWRKELSNAQLSGDALAAAVKDKPWDPSIKALVQFPDVLANMSEKLDWTQSLGDAFVSQQNAVMDEIQFLRAKADDAGHLKSNDHQRVTKEGGSGSQPTYVIAPVDPEVVYVPAYEPSVVYGSWWYPDYPPYAWSYPGVAFVDGFYWGAAGIAIASGIWGWNHWNWHDRHIDIDVNKWNRINVNRNRTANNVWKNDARHRGDVRRKAGNVNRGDIERRLKNTDRQASQKAVNRAEQRRHNAQKIAKSRGGQRNIAHGRSHASRKASVNRARHATGGKRMHRASVQHRAGMRRGGVRRRR